MNITLRQLSYLVALAEERHFGRAAARVHVTQPALSTQIRELEDRLGAPLIDRTDREFRLTPAGREVLEGAHRIMAEVERIETQARWGEGLSGRLKLGIIPTVAPYLLPVALPMLRMRDVTLDLRLTEAKTERVLAALADGQLDAAVVAIPAGLPGLIERPLFRDRFLLAASRASVAAVTAKGPVLPEELNPNALLLLDEGHCLADQALEVCGTSRGQTRVDLRASSLPTLCGMVAAGFGQTLLPEISLSKECAAAPDMDVLAFAEPQPARTIGLVRRDLGGPEGWFSELGEILATAGRELLGHDAAA
ncbi:LysR substrate-binding domain-containing protein [Maritimibacter sp. DP1N21-5]|uniref:LysR substrate-binding domain-containing protein n=1 Tax=Maritimibacter sp. DP1N21-5 TaxID=2836867 RepID=UPI001C455B5C|nr:LysR substrate-binding domain-containing protein [Maritimibacter sp. DP1N21-5]MBV7409762.1 LysR family transcriptional regulator [Maritimibacter sp. DP1N21-5]